MKTFKIVVSLGLCIVLLVTALVACDDDDSDTPSPSSPSPSPTVSPSPTDGFELAKSDIERQLSPAVAQSDLSNLVAGNNAFALDMYKALDGEEGNLFFSPYSISVALAMTYAGARGATEQQMADVLHFLLDTENLHSAFNALDLVLTEDTDAPPDEMGDPFILNIANSLWGQSGYPFLQDFLDTLAENYGAGMRLLDFVTASEPARITINDWVSDNTEQRIKDLIPEGAITDLTRLVLANAIYFKASWLHQFNENLTRDEVFHMLDGSEVMVPMMSLPDPEQFGYVDGDGYQAVEMPYVGGKAAMTLILPDEGAFADFEAGLSAELIVEIIAGLEHKSVELRLPKFSYEQAIGLNSVLAQMGMQDAFDPNVADFSGMDGTKLLYITDVFHKAFVAVDEKGTEAAAATAVIVGIESMPQIDVELTVDRPFIFLIRDTENGQILFTGRVLNPAV